MKITDIRIDGDTQSRAQISDATVTDYAEAIEAGAKLPAVVVFFDGVTNWLADGFHRFLAHKRVGCIEIDADVREGTQIDAQLFAYGANQTHGLRRTNEDKRKSVLGVLALRPEWSDVKIGRHVGVNDKTVAAHRKSILGNSEDAQTSRTVERGGKTYEQDLSGHKKAGEARKAERTIAEELQAQSSTGLPASVPPAIAANREPGQVSSGEEDDDLADVGESLDELVDGLQKDLAEAQERLQALSADDGKAQLLKAIQRAEHAERRRDEAMMDSSRAKARADLYERLLSRCGKAVGERDLDKVAPAVEAMARKAKGVAA